MNPISLFRSIRPEEFCKKSNLNFFEKFTRKQPRWRPILVKLKAFRLKPYENRT